MTRVAYHLKVGAFKRVRQYRSEPFRPCALGVSRPDQVLTDLDQGIGMSEAQSVTFDAVSIESATIGFVPAHADIAFFLQPFDQRSREAVILMRKKHADIPRARWPGLEARDEAMDREIDETPGARSREGRDFRVIRTIAQVEPPLTFRAIASAVSLDNRAIAHLHQQRWIILATIGIDDQAGECAKDGRRVQKAG